MLYVVRRVISNSFQNIGIYNFYKLPQEFETMFKIYSIHTELS